MVEMYFSDDSFENKNYADSPLPPGEYENCSFSNCRFAESDLSKRVFIDCEFANCDLSMAILHQTAFRNVRFIDCKLLGLHFDHVTDFLFEVTFKRCRLDLSSFYQRKMGGTHFQECSLKEVDFEEAQLSGAVFEGCDLSGAIFDHTLLKKADFRTAVHYVIDPEQNQVLNARFSVHGLEGLLRKYELRVE
jgi:fluoroquinolone resistance protein